MARRGRRSDHRAAARLERGLERRKERDERESAATPHPEDKKGQVDSVTPNPAKVTLLSRQKVESRDGGASTSAHESRGGIERAGPDAERRARSRSRVYHRALRSESR